MESPQHTRARWSHTTIEELIQTGVFCRICWLISIPGVKTGSVHWCLGRRWLTVPASDVTRDTSSCWWDENWGETPKNAEEASRSATWSIWIDLGLNLERRGKKPAVNFPNYGPVKILTLECEFRMSRCKGRACKLCSLRYRLRLSCLLAKASFLGQKDSIKKS